MDLTDFGPLLGLHAKDVLTSPDVYTLGKWTVIRLGSSSARSSGVSFGFGHGRRLQVVFFYSEGYGKFAQFRGQLVGGVTFADDQKTVRKKLGAPTSALEQTEVPVLGIMGARDGYLIGGLAIQFTFSPTTGTVQHVNIVRPEDRLW